MQALIRSEPWDVPFAFLFFWTHPWCVPGHIHSSAFPTDAWRGQHDRYCFALPSGVRKRRFNPNGCALPMPSAQPGVTTRGLKAGWGNLMLLLFLCWCWKKWHHPALQPGRNQQKVKPGNVGQCRSAACSHILFSCFFRNVVHPLFCSSSFH